jgi:hypothetical protein
MSVIAVSKSEEHHFTKSNVVSINLVAGHGIEGDCHAGVNVQHRSRLHIQPPPPNLRQVHLIPLEILNGVDVAPGQIGENITTKGLDLLAMGVGTRLHFTSEASAGSETGEDAGVPETEHPVVVLRGLRNPCPQIDKYRPGLKEKFIERDGERKIARRLAGVMGTVEIGGEVRVGMSIVVEPAGAHEALPCV